MTTMRAKKNRRRRKQRDHQPVTLFDGIRTAAAPAAPNAAHDHGEMQVRDLTARELTVRAASYDEETRSVEAVFATEQPVQVFDMRSFEIIDEVLVMRGAQIPQQIPVLDSHMRFSTDDVHGSGRSMRVDRDQLIGRIHFAADDDSQRNAEKVRDGHITDVSVGYRVLNYVDIPEGKTQRVNGRDYTAGVRTLRVTTEWAPKEISLVPIGADEAAKFRQERQTGRPGQRTESTIMDPRLRKYLESLGLRKEATEEEARAFQAALGGERAEIATVLDKWNEFGERVARAALKDMGVNPDDPTKKLSAPGTPGSNPPAGDGGQRTEPEGQQTEPSAQPNGQQRSDNAAAAAERTRVNEILGLRLADTPDELVRRAISEGMTPVQAENTFLRHQRETAPESVGAGTPSNPSRPPAGQSRNPDNERTIDTMVAALALRTGATHDQLPVRRDLNLVGDARRQYQERLAEQADRLRDLSLLDICRESVRLDGHQQPMGRNDLFELMQTRGAATGSAANIFTTSFNARLMRGFAEYPDSTMGWVNEEDLPDFKTNDIIDVDGTMRLRKHGRGGTADETTKKDDVESYKAARYTAKATFDEMDIIDDRFGALMRTADEMAKAAARLRPDLVYALLLANPTLNRDSVAVFHSSSHGGNLITDVLGQPGLKEGITVMGKQTRSGVNLNLKATHLLVPFDLKFTAGQLLNSSEVRSTEALTSGGAEFGTSNELRGENLTRVVDNRIGVAGVTDPASGIAYAGSATNWFLVAAGNPGVLVGYGPTGRRPQIRPYTLDKGEWGMGWDVKFDIVAMIEHYFALLKSTGGG